MTLVAGDHDTELMLELILTLECQPLTIETLKQLNSTLEQELL